LFLLTDNEEDINQPSSMGFKQVTMESIKRNMVDAQRKRSIKEASVVKFSIKGS